MREDMNSNHFTVWLLPECIHRLDPPYISDLLEPIFSRLGKSIAEIFDEVQQYMKDNDIENMKITTEKSYIDIIDLLRRNLSKLKNILKQQQRIWDIRTADFKDKAENTSK
jgi:hypothetical protein